MAGPPPLRILVADDESQICRLVRDALRPMGYAIDISPDGRDILQKYRSGEYGLIILDPSIRKDSGLEIIVTLRNRGDGIPIIVMSGPLIDSERIDSFAFTYRVDILRKPFGLGDLRAAVDRATGAVSA